MPRQVRLCRFAVSEEENTVSPSLTAKRLQVVPVEASTYAISTDQKLNRDEIASSVRTINELTQHSYAHVIRIDRPSFRRAGEWRIKPPYSVGKKKISHKY